MDPVSRVEQNTHNRKYYQRPLVHLELEQKIQKIGFMKAHL